MKQPPSRTYMCVLFVLIVFAICMALAAQSGNGEIHQEFISGSFAFTAAAAALVIVGVVKSRQDRTPR